MEEKIATNEIKNNKINSLKIVNKSHKKRNSELKKIET